MAFKMKGNPYKMGKMATKSATKMAKEAMKMKKESMAKLKEESAMKLKTSYKMKEAMAKMKEASAMKQAKPDYPDIDKDGNTTESMKKAAADKKSLSKEGMSEGMTKALKKGLKDRNKEMEGKTPGTGMKQRVPSDKDQKKIKDKIDLEIRTKQLGGSKNIKRPNKKSATKMKPGRTRSKADKKQFADVGPRKASMSEAMAAGATAAAASKKADKNQAKATKTEVELGSMLSKSNKKGSRSNSVGGGMEKKSPNKLMGKVKKKVNKELESPAGKAAMSAVSGGMMMKKK